MSKLDELIQQHCPDGVEYKPIGTVVKTLKKGTLKQGELVIDGLYPVVNSGREYYGRYNDYNNEGDAFTFASRGEYAGFVNYHSDKFWAGGLCYPYRSKDESKYNTKYLYYASKNKEKYIRESIVCEGSIPALNKADIEDFEIPLPPLPVQEEVVRILDKFTELEQELEQELELRKKQYEYYRDKILSLSLSDYDGEVEWKSLDEIATNWFRGNGIKRDEVIEDGNPCIRYGELYTTYGLHFTDCVSHTSVVVLSNPKIAKKGAILFAITGENVEDIAMSTAYLGEEDIYVGGDILVMEHEQDAKYLSYVLSTTDARKQKSKGRIKSKVVHSNKNDISQIIIPVPKDTNEQRRVADVLDRFYNLINNISEGLPVEIKMRHQQYEYYRDKLLNFKRLEVV